MTRGWSRAAGWLLAAATALAGAQTTAVLPPPHEMVASLKPASTRSTAPASLSLAVHFEAHSPRVRPASGPLLGNLVAALLAPELQGSRFVIEGPGEPEGAASGPARLSQQRADEIRLYLVALGVPAARLRAVGTTGDDVGSGSETQPTSVRRVRVIAHD